MDAKLVIAVMQAISRVRRAVTKYLPKGITSQWWGFSTQAVYKAYLFKWDILTQTKKIFCNDNLVSLDFFPNFKATTTRILKISISHITIHFQNANLGITEFFHANMVMQRYSVYRNLDIYGIHWIWGVQYEYLLQYMWSCTFIQPCW